MSACENNETIDISVTIIGSGTCVPSLERSACSVLVETGKSKILLDSGPGTMRRLLETGTSIFDISHIFYSHFHPDHTAELVPFLFALKCSGAKPKEIPFVIGAGTGFSDFFNRLRNVYGDWIELTEALIMEFDNKGSDSAKFPDFIIETLPVDHNPESVAYRITGSGNKTVVYSGDTDYCDNLISLSEKADLLICESALPDEMKKDGHLSPSTAGKIASLANVEKLVLTHFYPECDKVDIEKQCRKTYNGPLVTAKDLMRIDLYAVLPG